MILEGLDHEQQQDYQKYLDIKAYLEENQLKVDAYVPLKNEQTAFLTNLAAIIPLAAAKSLNTTGFTTGKVTNKVEAATAFGSFVPVARGFCIKKGLNEAAANLRWTRSKLLKLDDGKFLETCTLIRNLIVNELIPLADFDDYNITVAMVDAALDKATAFNNSRGVAASAEAVKESKADQLEELFDTLRGNNEQFTLLMNFFQETDEDFYKGYVHANVEVDNIRHTGISGEVKDAEGNPINNAEIVNLKSGRKVKTNLLAEYDHEPNRSGLTEFECTAPGRQPVKKIIDLKRGKSVHTDWVLQPATA